MLSDSSTVVPQSIAAARIGPELCGVLRFFLAVFFGAVLGTAFPADGGVSLFLYHLAPMDLFELSFFAAILGQRLYSPAYVYYLLYTPLKGVYSTPTDFSRPQKKLHLQYATASLAFFYL